MRCILGRIWATSSPPPVVRMQGLESRFHQPADPILLGLETPDREVQGWREAGRGSRRPRHWIRFSTCLTACVCLKWGCNDIQDIHVWPLDLWIMQAAMWEGDSAICYSAQIETDSTMTGEDKQISHCWGSLCKADIIMSLVSVREKKETNGCMERLCC